MHPHIVLSAVPLALSMPGWESGDHDSIARFLAEGITQVARAAPIPGLHIADVVCNEIERRGWKRVGLLGTRWTMTGPVYANALAQRGREMLVPDEPVRERLNTAIFDELCRGAFTGPTTGLFIRAIEELRERGAERVVLGCTEIPLIINAVNSPLPVLDTTRLLATRAIEVALDARPLDRATGWIGRSTA